jgi:hypothetical protein
MAIVFDRDFGRVWSDGATPCVFSSLVRVPTKTEMDDLADKQLELIRELTRSFDKVYSILDLRLCPPVPMPIIVHYITSIIPQQFNAGLVHKAFVAPEERKSYEVLIEAFTVMTEMPISLHTTFENALNMINDKRMQSRLKKPTSFFRTLLAKSWRPLSSILAFCFF